MMRVLAAGMLLGALMLAFATPPALGASQNPDVARLSDQLNRLSEDPVLGQYATGQQALARSAIAVLQDAGRGERDHALFMAEQRVALAEASAKGDADRAKLDQLQREHDRIMLEASQAEAATARAELARQRLQYEAAAQQAQMLQEQGAQASQQAQQAQAEAAQAKRLAAAQGRAAALARKQAQLAEAATQALKSAGGSAPAASASAARLHLSAASFGSGSGDLTASGRRRVAGFARAHANQRIVIEPRGSSDARVLAGRRAVAVEAALAAAGAGQVSIRPVGSASSGAEVEIRAEP